MAYSYGQKQWTKGEVITAAALQRMENALVSLVAGAANLNFEAFKGDEEDAGDRGSATQPIYLDGGKFTASDGNVGSTSVPIYLKNGILTQASSIFQTLSSDTNILTVKLNGTTKQCDLVNSVSNTLTPGTSSAAPKIKTTVNGVSGSNITLTTATTDVYGVTKLSSTSSSSEEGLAATPKGVWAAINTLDVSAIAGAASKTLTSISETNGKISATYSDIAIKSSQITDRGTANGVATLDANGKVPSLQLPSYVDDVLEYSASSSFPSTGETGKIYVDTSTNKSYRWSGSQYVVIASDLALGTTSSTAYRGDYGNTAYKHATDANRLTTAQPSGLYKIATTAHGHVASVTAIEKSDITNLGIPAQDTVYTHPTFTAYESGLYKITVNNEGHVSAATPVSANDIASLAESAINTAINNMISNFGLTLQMPSITWTEDDTNGIISATADAYQNETTVVIEKEVSGAWVTYTEGDNWAIGDAFRATCTRTATISGQTYTNTLTDTHTTTTEYTGSASEPEEP